MKMTKLASAMTVAILSLVYPFLFRRERTRKPRLPNTTEIHFGFSRRVTCAKCSARFQKDHMLLSYRNTFKTLAELNQSEVRLGGLRINPVTNISSSVII